MKAFISVKNCFSPNNNKKNQNLRTPKVNSSKKKIFTLSSTENRNNQNKKILIKKNIKQKTFNSEFELEKKIYKNFKKAYSNDLNFYNIKIINEIISNENTHIVSEFKDYLIEGDYSEFLQKYYNKKEIFESLPKIFDYYENCSVIFPNYIILPESKYLYKNIQKKQRIIDQQQELEDEKEKKLQRKNINNFAFNIIDDEDIVFNDKAIDSILNQTDTSGVKQFFGLNNDNDCSNTFNMDNVVKMIDNAEKEKIKKSNALYKNKVNVNCNVIIKNNIKNTKINSSVKGKNHKRYVSDISTNNNNNYNNNLSNNKSNNLLNISSKPFIKRNNLNNNSNIYMDQKYNNNTIYISSPCQINQNNKPFLINNLLVNNGNNNITIKAIEEKKLKNQKINKSKFSSPLSKTDLNNKVNDNNKNKISNQNKILSYSSSKNNNNNFVMTSYYTKNKFSYNNISNQNNNNPNHHKIKSQTNLNTNIKIPLSNRDEKNNNNGKNEIMKMFNNKIKKNKNLNEKKFSYSTSTNKKNLTTSIINKESNISSIIRKPNYNNTENINILKNKINKLEKNNINISNTKKNKTYISVTHRNYNSLIITNNKTSNSNITNNNTITKTNTNISKTERLINDEQNEIYDFNSPKKSSDFEKVLKTYEYIPMNSIHERNKSVNSNIKKIRKKIILNNIFSNKIKNSKSIKGIEIKGFEELIKKSRNGINENNEKIPFNMISKSNRNSTSILSNKVLSEMYKHSNQKK